MKTKPAFGVAETVASAPVAYEPSPVVVPLPMGDALVSTRLCAGRFTPAAAMVNVYFFTTSALAPSVASTVKVNTPLAVGVPETIPVTASKFIPAGSAPPLVAVKGAFPASTTVRAA